MPDIDALPLAAENWPCLRDIPATVSAVIYRERGESSEPERPERCLSGCPRTPCCQPLPRPAAKRFPRATASHATSLFYLREERFFSFSEERFLFRFPKCQHEQQPLFSFSSAEKAEFIERDIFLFRRRRMSLPAPSPHARAFCKLSVSHCREMLLPSQHAKDFCLTERGREERHKSLLPDARPCRCQQPFSLFEGREERRRGERQACFRGFRRQARLLSAQALSCLPGQMSAFSLLPLSHCLPCPLMSLFCEGWSPAALLLPACCPAALSCLIPACHPGRRHRHPNFQSAHYHAQNILFLL